MPPYAYADYQHRRRPWHRAVPWIEVVRHKETTERFRDQVGIGVRIGRRALQNGLLCRFDPHWLAFGPPPVSTAEQIDEMVAVLDRGMGEVLAEVP